MAPRKKKKKADEEKEVLVQPAAPREVEEASKEGAVEYKMLAGQEAKDYVESKSKKPKLVVSPPPVVPGRKYSFNQWAASRGKKPHHLAGLRAFCKSVQKKRTFEEWDEVFKGY